MVAAAGMCFGGDWSKIFGAAYRSAARRPNHRRAVLHSACSSPHFPFSAGLVVQLRCHALRRCARQRPSTWSIRIRQRSPGSEAIERRRWRESAANPSTELGGVGHRREAGAQEPERFCRRPGPRVQAYPVEDHFVEGVADDLRLLADVVVAAVAGGADDHRAPRWSRFRSSSPAPEWRPRYRAAGDQRAPGTAEEAEGPGAVEASATKEPRPAECFPVEVERPAGGRRPSRWRPETDVAAAVSGIDVQRHPVLGRSRARRRWRCSRHRPRLPPAAMARHHRVVAGSAAKKITEPGPVGGHLRHHRVGGVEDGSRQGATLRRSRA